MYRKPLTLILLVLVLLAVLPRGLLGVATTIDPWEIHTDQAYQQPSQARWFGTDNLGRDVSARTMYATGLTFNAVFQSVAVSFVLALLLGGIAGLTSGKWPDAIISWIISLLYTVPFVLIAVAVAAVIQPDIGSTYLLIGLIGWAAPARLFRAEVMQLRESRFIIAQRALGISPMSIFLRSILPLAVIPPFLSILYFLPELVSIDVGLSFFGLGAQPPVPTLGRLIYDGSAGIRIAWWITALPATFMLIIFALLYQIPGKLSHAFSNK